ncbi:hypothetical protein Q31b_23960 [Novipirellula aureliae]|uniref:Uncharacterized protein n=1 Tax=Novipirellula aureliae TaxID=2527966 RepID=A0A5C6E5X3_9BACT|nr:hypothetical protein Q31b_23960 [Novipirellula aureliae]
MENLVDRMPSGLCVCIATRVARSARGKTTQKNPIIRCDQLTQTSPVIGQSATKTLDVTFHPIG